MANESETPLVVYAKRPNRRWVVSTLCLLGVPIALLQLLGEQVSPWRTGGLLVFAATHLFLQVGPRESVAKFTSLTLRIGRAEVPWADVGRIELRPFRHQRLARLLQVGEAYVVFLPMTIGDRRFHRGITNRRYGSRFVLVEGMTDPSGEELRLAVCRAATAGGVDLGSSNVCPAAWLTDSDLLFSRKTSGTNSAREDRS